MVSPTLLRLPLYLLYIRSIAGFVTPSPSFSHYGPLSHQLQSTSTSSLNQQSPSLQDCVCVVTGATRGIGKGIAIELGKAGATVYVTGTSSSASKTKENDNDDDDSKDIFVTNDLIGGPGTIEETAQEVTDAGGHGVPVLCDHSKDDQVKALFDKIENDHGRLDILVNNCFRIPPGGTKSLFSNFWEIGTEVWDTQHTIGCRSHYVASCYAVPLMIRNKPKAQGNMKRPFIAMISSFGGLSYTFNCAYGVQKCAVDRLAKDMAVELKSEDIGVSSFYPGLVLTERTQMAVDSGDWEEEVGLPLDNSETPRFSGRAIVAVATDQSDDFMDMKSGKVQIVAELAKEYGFTDENGRQPPSIRSLKFLLPTYGMDEETRKKVPDWLIPDLKIPFFVMAGGQPPSD